MKSSAFYRHNCRFTLTAAFREKNSLGEARRPSQACSGFSYPIRIKVGIRVAGHPIFFVNLPFLLCKKTPVLRAERTPGRISSN
jgi:hypothetical protein